MGNETVKGKKNLGAEKPSSTEKGDDVMKKRAIIKESKSTKRSEQLDERI